MFCNALPAKSQVAYIFPCLALCPVLPPPDGLGWALFHFSSRLLAAVTTHMHVKRWGIRLLVRLHRRERVGHQYKVNGMDTELNGNPPFKESTKQIQ